MNLICRIFGVILLLPLLAYSQMQNRVIELPVLVLQSNFVKGADGKLVSSDIQALEIIEIKVGDKSVSLGENFSAENDWLKDLAVKVRNISGKPISSIRIGFILPEAKFKDSVMGFSLQYGKALSTGIDYGEQKIIMPGEEVILHRSEAHYNRDRDGITQKSGVTNFNKLLLGATTVQFEDNMVWSSWKLPVSGEK